MKHMDQQKRNFLRATALASLGGSLMASAQAKASENEEVTPPLKDPKTAYPQPPFRSQKQPWPGLQSKMSPSPDCGERTYKGSNQLKGRHALITGGDSGIGRAVAIAYAREGADVAINYLPQEEEDAREVINLIRREGRRAVALSGDLRDEDFCRRLVQNAHSKLGGLDILVSNAGRQEFCRDVTKMTTEQFDWTLKTNIYALFWLVKYAVPLMPKGSSIINTSSRQAYDPSAILVDYAMTKAGISSMTRSLAKQLLPRGIRVNAVEPGPFWTPLEVSGAVPPENIPRFGAETQYQRPGQPVELAFTYITLASTKSSYVTGQNWGMTGGNGVPG